VRANTSPGSAVLEMMPLTKPPPLMTTLLHTYGPGGAVSSDGITAGPA
jgi:hypothetical protein